MTQKRAASRIAVLDPIASQHAASKGYVDGRGAILLDGDGEPYYSQGQIQPGVGIPLGMRYAGRGASRDTFRPGVLANLAVSDVAPAFVGQKQITYDEAQAAGFQHMRGGIMAPRTGLDVVKYNNANGTTEGTSFDLETRLSGSKISAHLFFWEGSNVQIWINNQPLSRLPVPSPGINSQFVTMEFSERDEYDIGISLTRGGGFVQWLIPSDASLMTPPNPRDKWFWISDSYGTGAYGTTAFPDNNFLSTAPYWFFKYLGADGFNMAQGGTGYLNDSGPSGVAANQGPYGGTKRREQLAKLPQDLTAGVFFGSANDAQGQWSAEQIKAAAKAAYAMVATDRPGLPLIVFGAEPGLYPGAGIDTVLLNAANNAIKAACDESPNVRKFIDMRNDVKNIFTGTGYQGGAVGDGNQDFMVSNDKIHATPDGFKHIGLWCADQARKVVL